jgi:molecular chaperone DnaJ
MPTMDYYRTLGVTPGASDDDIKKAYRQLVFRYHPDRNPGDQAAEVKIREINAAYEILGDPEARRTYERLRFGAVAREDEVETVPPEVVLAEMEAKLEDEARKEAFAAWMKQVARIKSELALIRERTVAQQGYDSFHEPIVAQRAGEVLDEAMGPDAAASRRRLIDVAVQMMIGQRVVGRDDEYGIVRLRARLDNRYRKGWISGYMAALELFHTRR